MRRTDMEIGGEYVVRGGGLGFIRVRLVSFEARAWVGSDWRRKRDVSPRHVTVEVVENVGPCCPSANTANGHRWGGVITPGDVVGIATRDIAGPWSEDVRREYEANVARREAKAEKVRGAIVARTRIEERILALGLTGRVVTRGAAVEMTLTGVAQIERVLALVEQANARGAAWDAYKAGKRPAKGGSDV